MLIFYSGSAGALPGRKLVAEPEVIFGRDAVYMLSYYLITEHNQDQHLRFKQIVKRGKQSLFSTAGTAAR